MIIMFAAMSLNFDKFYCVLGFNFGLFGQYNGACGTNLT